MHYYEVAPNKLIRIDSFHFTYASENVLNIGQIVIIEIGKTRHIGIVLKETTRPSYATKSIYEFIEGYVIPGALLSTALWISGYYATHFSSVLQTILPRGITKNRRARIEDAPIATRLKADITLTAAQTKAVETLAQIEGSSAILHGVTGAGKTQVYIELAKLKLAKGQSAIILVPEIALTSQLLDEFSHHFPTVLVNHSAQTEAQRHGVWEKALKAVEPVIAIGPRSTLFLPLSNIGLIVVDECHEPSFKQEQTPRYSALRVASVLAKKHGGLAVFGSATPLVVDYYQAEQQNLPIITLPLRARTDAVAPKIELIDMTKRNNFKNHRFLSDKLLEAIADAEKHSRQVLIFHNRRGTASTTLCENCGWIATDPDSFIPLTLHADTFTLRSHISDYSIPVPTSCPVCSHADIIHKGIGTKLIESELARLFPKKVIARFDGDTEADYSVEKRYAEIYNADIEILIGTQVLAKGLDLPHLRTVGIIQADAGLSLPDYASSERTFDLLAQVIGRVGRSHHESTVVVQSYQPSHPAIVDGIAQDYADFHDSVLIERRRGSFPPYSFLLRLTCQYKTESSAISASRKLSKALKLVLPATVSVLGPAPAFYEYQAGTYRWQLTLKSPKRQYLLEALKILPTSHWQFELDPTGLS